jgi:arylsulfatase A-like enzyme
VRVVELIDTGSSDNWDAHDNMDNHRPKARRVDQALAALIKDLKQRGLFRETLLAGCTEFGRSPWTDNATSKGRNHYAKAFSSFLTGAGVRGGTAYGETDEYGIKIIANPVHVHDYHATILHLMGLDHEKLTYRYAGRDFRLTDVAGKVIEEILV